MTDPINAAEPDYLGINRENWNRRLASHLDSAFYDMPAFLRGENSLKAIELGLLGEPAGKSILHLQCHFGQDSLSMARMGAEVTGVDLSDLSIEKARELNNTLGLSARFVCCDLYSLPGHLDEQFDLVFTSYGTIGWLPDLQRWAGVVNRFLKPGGQFVMVDFHPVLWMLDEDFSQLHYRYFNDAPIIESVSGTYAEPGSNETFHSISWNHGMAEIIGSLMKQELSLKHFGEYDYSPYNCFPGMKEEAKGIFRFEKWGNRLPLVYSLVFIKEP